MSESDLVREFVLAAHGNLEKVKQLYATHPHLLHETYDWGQDNLETALQAAAHMGAKSIVEFLLDKGAAMTLPTAAMLGDAAQFQTLLEVKPGSIHEPCVHGISLLYHAGHGGNLAIVEQIVTQVEDADISRTLISATQSNHPILVKWLLERNADTTVQDFFGRTPLQIAVQLNYDDVADVLRTHIGDDNLE